MVSYNLMEQKITETKIHTFSTELTIETRIVCDECSQYTVIYKMNECILSDLFNKYITIKIIEPIQGTIKSNETIKHYCPTCWETLREKI